MKIAYIGTLNEHRLLLELVEVIRNLPGVQLTLGGMGKIRVELHGFAGTQRIKFLGAVPTQTANELLSQSDVMVCMLNPLDKNCKYGTPNKLYEAMKFAKPIVVTKGTLSGKIAQKERCGIAIDFNKAALRNAIMRLQDPRLRSQLGRNGLMAYKREYNWAVDSRRLLDAYKTIWSEI